MGIIFGSARIDENGNISGGAAGDQTGSEVSTQPYYMHSKGWYALRPKDANAAAKIATAMQQACDNNHIGYDQNQRNTCWSMLKRYGSLAAIAENCETDCSALVRCCIYQGTGRDVGDMYTGNLASNLENSGLFNGRFSVSSESQLYNGDVLVTKSTGHTVIVVSGRPRSGGDSGGGDSSTWKATGTATCTDNGVNVRSTPGGTVIGQCNKGNRFEIDGQVSGDWVHINVAGIGVGYMHKDYVKYDSAPTPAPSSTWKAVGTATCTDNSVNVRSTPNGTVIGQLNQGNRFEVDGQTSDGWVHVNVAGIGIGWVYGQYVKYDSTPNSGAVDAAASKNSSFAGTYQVVGTGAEGLSLRSGAGTGKSLIATIPEGGKVQNYGYYTASGGYNWLLVTYGDKQGYVCNGGYLKKV